ncbi:FMN-binding glutamate synthase family protein [Desulfosporosinus sp. Sb-LF]|uniref:FMN-binding glutamate synthase family protein n=1 Tax=Desulfosporosinus sp. Sb-LF TaxID=2560027 RepID=UPI00107FBE7B|nr:FMN-binding glutamate synthase family protein [Desulfosporosinus sp. Sb-LF]TGE31596.1 FMN-binding glutamate synthase family protein [Desulfosporosinus sp. Sb-LF]
MLSDLMLRMLNPVTDDMFDTMMTEPYANNPFLMMTIMEKMTMRAIAEAGMRAQTGQALSRPIGSPLRSSPWEKLLLNPRQLFELPTEDEHKIEMKVTIGPRAKKPLIIDIPIMITGMSYGGSLSLTMKEALAKGASKANTATNTGESAVSREERDAAKFLIGQYNRGGWLNDPQQLKKLDAIEVQLGQGAWGGAVASTMDSSKMDDHLRELWKVKPGETTGKKARFPKVNTPQDIISLVNSLKEKYDVPVGIKIAGTHFMEKELEIIAQTKADFITIDGQEGGTAASAPTLEDDLGLPTLFTIARTVDWLKKQGLRDRFTIIGAGGLRTPGEFLKALALGADAVYIGSIALIATMQSQMTKALPQSPAPQLALYDGKFKEEFDPEEGSQHLANFLKSCSAEMVMALQAMGKSSVRQLGREDLVSIDQGLAKALHVGYVGEAKTSEGFMPLAAR